MCLKCCVWPLFLYVCLSVLFNFFLGGCGAILSTWQLNGTACALTDVSKWEDSCLL